MRFPERNRVRVFGDPVVVLESAGTHWQRGGRRCWRGTRDLLLTPPPFPIPTKSSYVLSTPTHREKKGIQQVSALLRTSACLLVFVWQPWRQCQTLVVELSSELFSYKEQHVVTFTYLKLLPWIHQNFFFFSWTRSGTTVRFPSTQRQTHFDWKSLLRLSIPCNSPKNPKNVDVELFFFFIFDLPPHFLKQIKPSIHTLSREQSYQEKKTINQGLLWRGKKAHSGC